MEHAHLDVLIVGAGLSGICAARYLQLRCLVDQALFRAPRIEDGVLQFE